MSIELIEPSSSGSSGSLQAVRGICAGVNPEDCKHGIPSKEPIWRKIPVTVGLLVAIIVGIGSSWAWIESRTDHLNMHLERSIDRHSGNEKAHPGIRTAVKESEYRLVKRIDRLESALLGAMRRHKK